MTQACCFSLWTYISLLSWRESPCLMLIQHPSLAPSDSHSFPTHWQMENATLFLRNVRGKCNALAWPVRYSLSSSMHCNLSRPVRYSLSRPTLFPGTLVNLHEHRALGGRSSRSALASSHTVEFCQKLTHPSTDERCAVIMEVSGYPEVRSDGFSHGIMAIPFPLAPATFHVSCSSPHSPFVFVASFFNPPSLLSWEETLLCYPFYNTEPLCLANAKLFSVKMLWFVWVLSASKSPSVFPLSVEGLPDCVCKRRGWSLAGDCDQIQWSW